MAARLGLDKAAVVAAAIDMVDREGLDALSLARLAKELGIRTPSLYAHVAGQRDLWRELWLYAVADFGEALRTSVMGRSRDDGLYAFATAFRAYALTFPGRYALTMRPPQPMDEVAQAARRRANEAYHAVMRSYGLTRKQEQNLGRAIRAAIHGFVMLETADGLAWEGADDSFGHMVALLAKGLQPNARALSLARS